MKRKLFVFAMCMLCVNTAVWSQITTGEPSARKIKTGNRAQAGDFGLYLGATSDMFKGIGDGDINIAAMPLVNLKYMYTDQLEFRLGLEFWKQKTKLKGETYAEEEDGAALKSKSLESKNYFYPGVAWHFSRNNILDVYAGAELPLGWNRYKISSASEYEGLTYSASTTRGTFDIGLGAFVGIQAYIANLPLALGIEYGISSMLHTGLQYKHTSKVGKEKEQVYYSADLESNDLYNDLKLKQGEIGNQVRVTLTYYFK